MDFEKIKEIDETLAIPLPKEYLRILDVSLKGLKEKLIRQNTKLRRKNDNGCPREILIAR